MASRDLEARRTAAELQFCLCTRAAGEANGAFVGEWSGVTESDLSLAFKILCSLKLQNGHSQDLC